MTTKLFAQPYDISANGFYFDSAEEYQDEFPTNFMHHYYDIYYLLQDNYVLEFIGTPEFIANKEKRFRSTDNPVISENEEFLVNDSATRKKYFDCVCLTRKNYRDKLSNIND